MNPGGNTAADAGEAPSTDGSARIATTTTTRGTPDRMRLHGVGLAFRMLRAQLGLAVACGHAAVVDRGLHLIAECGDAVGEPIDHRVGLVAVDLLLHRTRAATVAPTPRPKPTVSHVTRLNIYDARFRPRLGGSPFRRCTARFVPVPTASAFTTGLVNVRYGEVGCGVDPTGDRARRR